LIDDSSGLIAFDSVLVILVEAAFCFKIDERLTLASWFIGFIILYRGGVAFLLEYIGAGLIGFFVSCSG
jgi:hypothetical protein